MYIAPRINKDYVLDFCYKELYVCVWGGHMPKIPVFGSQGRSIGTLRPAGAIC